MKYIILAVILLAVHVATIAQAAEDIALLKVRGLSKANLHTSNPTLNEIEVESQTIELMVPIFSEEGIDINYGSSLSYTRDNFELKTVGNIGSVDLHTLTLNLFYTFSSSEQWHHTFQLTPGIYSDFDKVGGDDFLWSAGYIANYESSDRLNYDLGLIYETTFGDQALLPEFSVNYNPNDQWEFKLGLPQTDITYKLNKQIDVYLRISEAGNQWNLNTEDNSDIEEESVIALLGLRLNLGNNIWLGLEGGVETDRTITLVANDTQDDDSFDFDDATYIALQLRNL